MKLSHRNFLLALCGAVIAATSGCASKPRVLSFSVGEKVTVGKLIYQVIDAQWLTDVQGAKQSAKNRILQLHISITNSGGTDASLPFLRLIDAAGNEIVEFSEIEGNTQWLGPLRRLQPTLTEDGKIYFDVPIGAYKLEVIDNSDADNEHVAHIQIPASLAPPPVAPGAPGN